MKSKIVALMASALLLAGISSVVAQPAVANAATCYGSSCTGKNPNATSCAGDAITVASMDVQGDGMLELRYSPSCKANWGRFSTYWRADMFGQLTNTGLTYARVTAWNPGRPSQGVAQWKTDYFAASWWTKMVDGTIKACTGVELFSQDSGSQGWVWGPCV